jgi:hypothetical protein
MRMLIGGDGPGILEHTLDRDLPPVDLAIIRHPMLIDHRTHHSPLRRKLGSPVSRALIMHLRHQLSHVLHRVPHILMLHNARLRTMLPLSLYQESVIGNA